MGRTPTTTLWFGIVIAFIVVLFEYKRKSVRIVQSVSLWYLCKLIQQRIAEKMKQLDAYRPLDQGIVRVCTMIFASRQRTTPMRLKGTH